MGKLDGYNLLLVNDGNGNFEDFVLPLPGTVEPSRKDTKSIAFADVNDDGLLDVIVGNKGGRENLINNQILYNTGDPNPDSTFTSFDIPNTGYVDTLVIGVGSVMNTDGRLDMVFGNDGEENQLLVNRGRGSDSEGIEIDFNIVPLDVKIGGLTAVALDDVDGNGLVDIVIGYEDHPDQLLINYGNGFTAYDLPAQRPSECPQDCESDCPDHCRRDSYNLETKGLALYDIDNNGLLDIIIVQEKNDERHQILMNYGPRIFEGEKVGFWTDMLLLLNNRLLLPNDNTNPNPNPIIYTYDDLEKVFLPPLHLAIASSSTNVANCLLRMGADPSIRPIVPKDCIGPTWRNNLENDDDDDDDNTAGGGGGGKNVMQELEQKWKWMNGMRLNIVTPDEDGGEDPFGITRPNGEFFLRALSYSGSNAKRRHLRMEHFTSISLSGLSDCPFITIVTNYETFIKDYVEGVRSGLLPPLTETELEFEVNKPQWTAIGVDN